MDQMASKKESDEKDVSHDAFQDIRLQRTLVANRVEQTFGLSQIIINAFELPNEERLNAMDQALTAVNGLFDVSMLNGLAFRAAACFDEYHELRDPEGVRKIGNIIKKHRLITEYHLCQEERIYGTELLCFMGLLVMLNEVLPEILSYFDFITGGLIYKSRLWEKDFSKENAYTPLQLLLCLRCWRTPKASGISDIVCKRESQYVAAPSRDEAIARLIPLHRPEYILRLLDSNVKAMVDGPDLFTLLWQRGWIESIRALFHLVRYDISFDTFLQPRLTPGVDYAFDWTLPYFIWLRVRQKSIRSICKSRLILYDIPCPVIVIIMDYAGLSDTPLPKDGIVFYDRLLLEQCVEDPEFDDDLMVVDRTVEFQKQILNYEENRNVQLKPIDGRIDHVNVYVYRYLQHQGVVSLMHGCNTTNDPKTKEFCVAMIRSSLAHPGELINRINHSCFPMFDHPVSLFAKYILRSLDYSSVNRLWIHAFSIFNVTMMVAIVDAGHETDLFCDIEKIIYDRAVNSPWPQGSHYMDNLKHTTLRRLAVSLVESEHRSRVQISRFRLNELRFLLQFSVSSKKNDVYYDALSLINEYVWCEPTIPFCREIRTWLDTHASHPLPSPAMIENAIIHQSIITSTFGKFDVTKDTEETNTIISIKPTKSINFGVVLKMSECERKDYYLNAGRTNPRFYPDNGY